MSGYSALTEPRNCGRRVSAVTPAEVLRKISGHRARVARPTIWKQHAQGYRTNLANIKDDQKNHLETSCYAHWRTNVSNYVGKLPPETIDPSGGFPEDSLEVQYSATDDEQDFRPIDPGSPGSEARLTGPTRGSSGPGRRTTWSNHLIYDLIVTQLRGQTPPTGHRPTMRIVGVVPHWW